MKILLQGGGAAADAEGEQPAELSSPALSGMYKVRADGWGSLRGTAPIWDMQVGMVDASPALPVLRRRPPFLRPSRTPTS